MISEKSINELSDAELYRERSLYKIILHSNYGYNIFEPDIPTQLSERYHSLIREIKRRIANE